MKNLHYSNQVDLLLTVLGDIVSFDTIALKGGTAINLFLLDMPRLSVDIDLAFIEVLPREHSLEAIGVIFSEILKKLSRRADLRTDVKYTHDKIPKQILIQRDHVTIKAELNLILRGVVFDCVTQKLCEKATKLYGKELSVNCLSFEDLYAGKFCAALDRQHPRDLFDVYYFFKTFALSENLKKAFIVYLLSTNRPVHEIIRPTLLDQRSLFTREFENMTDEPFSYSMFEEVRDHFITELNKCLTLKDKEFLVSVESGKPEWELLPIVDAKDMPAIKWKLHNIEQMNPEKRNSSISKLREKLGL